MIFQLLWCPAHVLGRAQAWLARCFREGNPLEQILILPAWAVCRLLFLAMFAVCEAVA